MTNIEFTDRPGIILFEDYGDSYTLTVKARDTDTENRVELELSNIEIEDLVHFLQGKLSRNKRRENDR